LTCKLLLPNFAIPALFRGHFIQLTTANSKTLHSEFPIRVSSVAKEGFEKTATD
jgi:hypothetical protein